MINERPGFKLKKINSLRRGPICLPVAPHGVRFGQSASYHFRKPFKHLPGLPDVMF